MRFDKPSTSITDQIVLLRRERLVTLIDCSPLADPASMGFPEDWRERTAWRVGG
jgi:hypothetical protein